MYKYKQGEASIVILYNEHAIYNSRRQVNEKRVFFL